jgi:prepilin-type N-terminal cleavage/methylation domain-containing protein
MFKNPKTTNQMLTVRCQRSKVRMSGFTLIELLIVIAIIAIIAAVVFVALDPLTRFQDARDSSRWNDVNALLGAIKIDQVDNNGSYLWGVNNDTSAAAVVDTNKYMISNATTTSGCDDNCSAVTSDTSCVNIQGLVTEGYIGELPVSPNGAANWTGALTGYYMIRNESATGTISIYACEAENTSSISVTR